MTGRMRRGLRTAWHAVSRRDLARNTGWMLAGNVGRLGLQAVYFVVLARALGATSFGEFGGVAAIAAILVPFAPLGNGMLLVRDASREPALLRLAWGGALAAVALFGSLALLVMVGVAQVVLPASISPALVITVGIADLIGLNLVTIAGQVYQASDRLRGTAVSAIVLSAARCGAAVGFVGLGGPTTATRWGVWYLVATLAAALVTTLAAWRTFGRPILDIRGPLRRMRAGAYFSMSLSTASIYADIDKAMVARIGSLQAAGIYTAAYRVVSFAAVPVQSLVAATFPRFFRHGADGGLGATTRYARSLLRITVVYGIVATAALLLMAPLLSIVLGAEFAPAEHILRILACILIAQSMHLLLLNALTGADLQGLRTGVQLGVALLNVVLNLVLIPAFDTTGAAAATVATEFALLVVLVTCIRWRLAATARTTTPRLEQP